MPSRRSWSTLVGRVGRMSWDELRTRAHQEAAKRCDLMLSMIGARFVEEPGNSPSAHCGHFFFEQAQLPSILDFLRRRLPHVVEGIIHQAEQICRHRFDLLGYRSVNYGAQIDWHLDAIHGKRAPWLAWYKVPYLEFGQVGDSKITWELNRHQHLVTLAKAYRLTGQPQFALELFKQWYDWQRQNPYPMGINWASSLEVAIRSLSWIWVSRLLYGCSVVPKRFPSDLQRALMLSARHIARFPSTYFSPNTHLLGEGAGLFFIGTLCAETAVAHRWQRQGWQIVLREAQRQVRPDGMHFEHSTYYHTYALDFFLHARTLASRNGIAIPAEFDRTIDKMLEATCQLSRSGSLPRLGDDDGGRVFDPRRNRIEHMVDPLAPGAVLFNREDFKAAAGEITEEVIWLLGVEGGRQFEHLRGERSGPVSFALEPSGIHVMASSEPVAQQLVIDAGPMEPGRQGHRHADGLSAQLTIDGNAVLVDPGTFAYVGDEDARNYFRGTAAHNTVEVDGLSQGETEGPFAWRSLRRADVSRWVKGSTFDFFEGSHGGYRRLPDPVEHRRYIFYLKPHFWLIRDVLSGADVHQVRVHWHFSEGSLTAVSGGAMFSANQTGLGLIFGSNHQWSHETGTYWHSPEYGRREPAPLLRSTTKTLLPVELATLLVPICSTAGRLGVLEPLAAESNEAPVCAYRYTPAGAIDHLFAFAAAPGGYKVGPWSSDARFLFCTPAHGGRPDRFVLCDGSYLAFRGRSLLVARKCLTYAEFFADGDQPQFRCSNADAVCFDPTRGEPDLSRSGVLATV
jgi:hypothetical protein